MAVSDTLTKTKLSDGLWEGMLTLGGEFDAPPVIEARYRDKALDGLELRPHDQPGRFTLRLKLPLDVLSDGAHAIHFVDAESGIVLASETVLSGDTLAEDLRAEVELLRAELDMLKKAFRRHCVETA